MFILDTNIVSEFMRERPHPAVLHWLDDRMERDLFVAAVTQADCQIAAIAAARGGTVVTRNVRDFEGTGVAVVNPWDDV